MTTSINCDADSMARKGLHYNRLRLGGQSSLFQGLKPSVHIDQVSEAVVFHDRYCRHRTVTASTMHDVRGILVEAGKILRKLRKRKERRSLQVTSVPLVWF